MARPLEFDRDDAIQKAMRLFLKQGYEATSIDDLTSELKISRASLYNSFGDKRGLMLACIGCAEELGAEMRQGALLCKGRAKKVVRNLFENLVAAQLQDGQIPGCVFLTLGAELASADEEVQRRVAASIEASRHLFREILRREGHWTAKEVEQKSAALLSTLIALLMLLRLHPERALIDHIIAEALLILD